MSNTGFRGFADFANSSGSTTAAVLAAARSKKSQQPSTSSSDKSKSLRPSPIYTGSDQRLAVLFRKIGQKRDATTKLRALDELSTVVFARDDEEYVRPEKIAALTHLVFLHETKLGYDNNPSVRAGSYKALVATKSHVPKAWNGLFLGDDDEPSASNTVGMAWAARSDSSFEVARHAAEFIKLLSKDGKEITPAVENAVLSYSKLVLGCKRASNLQEVINPVSSASLSTSEQQSGGKDKKNKLGSKAAAKNAEAAAALAESEREEMEERYERVMLSVLIGLGSLVESNPESDCKQYTSGKTFPESASITRLLTSSRPSFRRECYNLVARFCQFAQSLVQPCTDPANSISLGTSLPNLISGEKDSSNFVALFELVLSYLSIFRKESESQKNPWEDMDSASFVKSLSKALRKACYGAPAASWGQMILPIVASLSYGDDLEHPLPLYVVESLWDGRKSAVVAMDAAAIVSSVVECVTYLLLRRPKDTTLTFTSQSWMACAQLLLDSLSYYLNEAPASGGQIESSLDELCTTIARDIVRLDCASIDDGSKDRGMSQIKSFFWGDNGVRKVLLAANRDRDTDVKLTRLMNSIIQYQDQQLNHIQPSASALFNAIIVHSDTRDNKSCTKEEVDMILNTITICGAQSLFPVQKLVETVDGMQQTLISLEEFCVNNLIRWIFIHSKSAPLAISTDFSIGKCLLLSIQSPHQQKQVWETVLRELIKSYCDLTTLAIGLGAMASGAVDDSVMDLIRCQTLDQFAIELSSSFMENFWLSHDLAHSNSQETIKYQGDIELFFKTCVGLSDLNYSMMVSPNVIKHWVKCCCDESKAELLIMEDEAGTNVLLETLLSLGSSSDSAWLSHEDSAKLIIESWREGGPIWTRTTIQKYGLTSKSTKQQEPLRDEFNSRASMSLRDSIRSKPSSDHAILELTSQSWSKRAARLLEMINVGGLEAVGVDIDLCKGVGDRNAAESLFLRIMYLLHEINCPTRSRELLLGKSTSQGLFIHILASFADPTEELRSFHQRTNRCRQLVEVLKGPELNSCARDLAIECIDLLSSHMKDPISIAIKCRQILSALSYVVSFIYTAKWSEKSAQDDCILEENVKEGDSIWYEKADGKRVSATVMKVHTDDFPNLYFTIKENNMAEERQTVSSRLRRSPVAPSAAPPTEEDKVGREHIARYIMDHLVKPYILNLNFHHELSLQNEISSECINIVVSQIGLLSVGIGSVRYEIVRIISPLINSFQEVLTGDAIDLDQATSMLRCISLALGNGLFTKAPCAGENLADLKLATGEMFLSILDLYDGPKRSTIPESFHSSVAMWLAVACSDVKDGEILRRLSGMNLAICENLLGDNLAESSIIVMKSIEAFQVSAKKCLDYSSEGSKNERQAFEKITKSFIDIADASDLWISSFALILNHYTEEAPEIVLNAANTFTDDLCDCLKSPVKQRQAFHMLMVHAKSYKPAGSIEDVALPFATKSLLSHWKEGLDEEDAKDLEDDVQVTAFWLCNTILLRLQTIDESYNGGLAQMGDLLYWIVFLEVFDNAGSLDMRNRSSMCVFLQKTNAVNFIMNFAAEQANLDITRKQNIFECVNKDVNEEFNLEDVATLALFRTIESVPTLAKTWFNDSCPRYLQQKLMSFVENKVAPETLQRELDRIKDATSFGEMTVNGSAVSREVVAIYHQDECQLSVTIRVPPAFPLRNVEVDLGKTLGIAEKRWRRWSLNIMLMLNNQDGSILDALLLWKENVDKEFEGVEPCPVCYSVLCIKTHSMPNLQCKTCNNKFHSQCLHKWFQSSGKSNCVLCQQPWIGKKIQ